MLPARGLLFATTLLLAVVASHADDVRRLQTYGGCPTWVPTPYSSEPSPFGWPLSPNDWSFADMPYWPKKYLACAGKRQSPIDIPLNSPSCGIDRISDQDGILKTATGYTAQGSVQPPEVRVSSYMRTVHAEGNYGDLRLRGESGEAKDYEAISVHLTAPSMHKVDGKHMAAELMVLHKPKGAPNMLKDGVILSMMFDDTNGTESDIFSQFGFSSEGIASPAKSWTASHYINLAEALSSSLEGPSYKYDGSVPVPPCTETVKYFVLGKAQPILTSQAKSLEAVLSCWAGGINKRGPIPSPFLGQCRAVQMNTLNVGSPHWEATCQAAVANGTSFRSGTCWDYGMSQEKMNSCVKSPVDMSASKASTTGSELPQWNFKTIKHVRVMPSNYSVDAIPLEAGVAGPLPNFGTILVLGYKYMVRKIRIKPVSSHTYNGLYHAGELIIECLVFGDEVATTVRETADFLGEQHHARRLQETEDELHRLYISVPIKLGVESPLLRELGLPFQAYKDSIKDMHHYHIETAVNLEAGIYGALNGNYLFYSGGMVQPGCPKWGVRWIMFETPITASLAQLNYLVLPVSGYDSVRLYPPTFAPQDYSKNVFLNALPDWALSLHVNCDDPEHWTYDDVHCWDVAYPTCRTGRKQSPINILPQEVQFEGNSRFLSRVDWKPVKDLRVENNGHSLIVTSDMLGYIKLIGDDGFPEFYDIAQFHLHMPSEHMINGRQFAAELHVVHTRQRAIGQEKNTYDSFPLTVLGFMFDITDTESHFLKQFYLGEEAIRNQSYKTAKQPIDLMRSLGPALDGDFYRYDGSFTTPDCHEQIKWFVFDHIFPMSLAQWETFKKEFPFAHANRPVNKLKDHRLVKNDFEEGTPVQYDFFLGRHEGRNRYFPGEGWILVPCLAIIVLMCLIMLSVFVREGRSRLESAGGLVETIGKISYNRM